MSDHRLALVGITQAELALTGLPDVVPPTWAFLDMQAGQAAVSIVRSDVGPPALPWAVRDRIALRFVLGASPDLEHLRALLAPGAAAALMLDVIGAGHVISYSRGRRIGCTSTEADGAIWDLMGLLRDLPRCGWRVLDSLAWLRGGRTDGEVLTALGLGARSTREEIDAAAGELASMAGEARLALHGRPLKFWLKLAVRRASLDAPGSGTAP